MGEGAHMLRAETLMRLRFQARSGPAMARSTDLPGGMVTKLRGRGLETADIRPFAHGDDPRHIDRNATARTGEPQTRSFHAERDRTTLLIADFRPSMLWGTRRVFRSVAAAEQLCLAGWRAVAEGGRVGLIVAWAGEPVFLRPQGRERGMVGVIGALTGTHARALAAPTVAEPDLAETLSLAARLSLRGSEIVLATGLDQLGAGFEEAVQSLTRRADLSLLRIVDAFEETPPRGTYRFLTRARHTATAVLGQPSPLAPHPAVTRLGLPCRQVTSAQDPLRPGGPSHG